MLRSTRWCVIASILVTCCAGSA